MITETKVEAFNFPNIGYLTLDVPEDVLQILTGEVDKIFADRKNAEEYNWALAGNIKNEFLMSGDARKLVEDRLAIPLAHEYGKLFKLPEHFGNNFCVKNNDKMVVSSLWVNMAESSEFNPIHDHDGVYSFVIWLDIPYLSDEQKKNGPGSKSNCNTAGDFSFHYTDVLGRITSHVLNVDNTWNGKMAFFPARLMHSVYPFYNVNGYRVTIAGNVSWDNR
jgi:hypothetical protein